MKQRILEHLGALVSCDTSKPAETMQVDDPIMQYAAGQLQAAGFTTEFQDLGRTCELGGQTRRPSCC